MTDRPQGRFDSGNRGFPPPIIRDVQDSRARVIVADDDVLLREGLAQLLSGAGFDVVGRAGDPTELLALARQQRPDLVIVDIRMPPTHTIEGLDAARVVRRELPGTAILVLSAHVEVDQATELLAGGAGSGYLLKDRVSDVDEFVGAVRRVAAGGSAIDPEIVSTMLRRQRRDDPLQRLTPREREVLALMVAGSSNQGIADALTITLRAAEKYVSSIFGKLGVPAGPADSRRVLAVLQVLRS
jgi:DNA-binding NarL/FixJ family response regulator